MSINETNRQYSLRHIKHETKLNNSFYSMFKEQNLVDVIVSSDGNNIRAHRLVLSANSSYFKNLFESISSPCQIPVIVLKDVPIIDLKAIIEFMYRGEVLVEEKDLSSVLKSAELLKVFGLTEVCLALRSRLISEGSVSDKSKPMSGPLPHKRPRINDGLKQTTQQSSDVLFSRINNARFDIRSINTLQSSANLNSSQQLLRTITSKPSTVTITSSPIALKTSTVVKNVILPTNQIHNKSQTTNTQIITLKDTITSSSQALPQSKATIDCTQTKSTLNSRPISSVTEKISPKRMISSTWTPSQQISLQNTSLQSPSHSTIPPIEVIIDEETHEMSETINSDIDIKPPIFELNKNIRLNNEKEMTNSQTESQSLKSTSDTSVKSVDQLTEESTTRSRTSSIKSRTSSTSSQSLPPPPTYRTVQRSSSRLLRNIIRPPPSLSPSTTTTKAKESEDKSKLKKVKKDEQLVGFVKFRKNRSDVEHNSGDSPEIECPSCGQKFNDEKNWNQHIASVHMHSKT